MLLRSAVAGHILIHHLVPAGAFVLPLAIHAAVHIEALAGLLAGVFGNDAKSLLASEGWQLRLILAHILKIKDRAESTAALTLDLWIASTILV